MMGMRSERGCAALSAAQLFLAMKPIEFSALFFFASMWNTTAARHRFTLLTISRRDPPSHIQKKKKTHILRLKYVLSFCIRIVTRAFSHRDSYSIQKKIQVEQVIVWSDAKFFFYSSIIVKKFYFERDISNDRPIKRNCTWRRQESAK